MFLCEAYDTLCWVWNTERSKAEIVQEPESEAERSCAGQLTEHHSILRCDMDNTYIIHSIAAVCSLSGLNNDIYHTHKYSFICSVQALSFVMPPTSDRSVLLCCKTKELKRTLLYPFYNLLFMSHNSTNAEGKLHVRFGGISTVLGNKTTCHQCMERSWIKRVRIMAVCHILSLVHENSWAFN